MMEVTGDNPRLLNLVDGNKQPTDKNYSATWNGLTKMSWLIRDSEIRGNINALYLNDELKASDLLTIDAGIRYEWATYTGFKAEEDWNHPGTLGDSTTMADDYYLTHTGKNQYWKYEVNKFTWSVGANLKTSQSMAYFARVSQGYRSPIEEAFFDNYGNFAAIKPTQVTQFELGLKYSTPVFALFPNVFYMNLDNIAFTDILANGQSENKFAGATNYGLELEALVKVEHLTVNLSGTVQNPKLKDFTGTSEALNDNQVRRIPKYYFILTPSYAIIKGLDVYASLSYFGKKFSDNENLLELPGYSVINAGVSYEYENLRFAVDATNLANTIGLTEGNPRSTVAATAGNLFMARPILGRTVKFSVGVNF